MDTGVMDDEIARALEENEDLQAVLEEVEDDLRCADLAYPRSIPALSDITLPLTVSISISVPSWV